MLTLEKLNRAVEGETYSRRRKAASIAVVTSNVTKSEVAGGKGEFQAGGTG